MVAVKKDSYNREILVRTEDDDIKGFSFLEIIERVDKLSPELMESNDFKTNLYYLETHEGTRIGFICKFILTKMIEICPDLIEEAFEVSHSNYSVKFRSTNFETRNGQIDKIARFLRDNSDIEDLIGWRDERYAVWSPEKKPYVLVERSMAGPLGIITYGVHINGYFHTSDTNEIRFWVPRRSATKPTWPYMLDNMVAGGIGYPYGIYETVLKESMEEARLPKDIIETSISNAGAVSYLFYQGAKDETEKFNNQQSYIVGEVEYVYDLKLDEKIVPKPNDGEVDSFNLFSLQEVVTTLQNAEFKPNSALVMVDFLIRHGFITPENEPNYLEIVSRMHRKMPFPTRN